MQAEYRTDPEKIKTPGAKGGLENYCKQTLGCVSNQRNQSIQQAMWIICNKLSADPLELGIQPPLVAYPHWIKRVPQSVIEKPDFPHQRALLIS